MAGKTNCNFLLVCINIGIIWGLVMFLIFSKTPVFEQTKKAKKVVGMTVIHFTDATDIAKAPRFLSQYLRIKNETTLTIFSGDLLSPSIASKVMKGDQMAHLFELLEDVVAVPGSHNYDFAEETFELFKGKAPKTIWLIANLKKEYDTKRAINDLSSFKVRMVNDIKVGVFGLIDEDWIANSSLKREDFVYEDFRKTAKRMGGYLRSIGCKIVFAITHMSSKHDELLLSDENGIDIVFGSKDHVYLVQRLNNKLLIKSESDFDYFSKLHLLLTDRKPHEYNFCNINCPVFKYVLDYDKNEHQNFFRFSLPRPDNNYLLVALDKIDVDEDDFEHEELKDYVKSVVNPTIFELTKPLFSFTSLVVARSKKMGNTDMPFGNFIADVARIRFDASVACTHAGMIGGDMTLHPGSNLHRSDLIKLLNSETSTFHAYELTGQAIVDFLNESVSKAPKRSSQFVSCSGLTFAYNPESEDGQKVDVDSVTIQSRKLDLDKAYLVVLPSELTDGVLGMKALSEKVKPSDAIAEYSTVSLIEDYVKLLDNPEHRKEFQEFRQMMPRIDLKDFDGLILKNRAKRIELYFAPDFAYKNALNQLNSVALRRAKFYSLAYSIAKRENTWVFVLNLKKEKRVKVILKG